MCGFFYLDSFGGSFHVLLEKVYLDFELVGGLLDWNVGLCLRFLEY